MNSKMCMKERRLAAKMNTLANSPTIHRSCVIFIVNPAVWEKHAWLSGQGMRVAQLSGFARPSTSLPEKVEPGSLAAHKSNPRPKPVTDAGSPLLAGGVALGSSAPGSKNTQAGGFEGKERWPKEAQANEAIHGPLTAVTAKEPWWSKRALWQGLLSRWFQNRSPGQRRQPSIGNKSGGAGAPGGQTARSKSY